MVSSGFEVPLLSVLIGIRLISTTLVQNFRLTAKKIRLPNRVFASYPIPLFTSQENSNAVL